MSRQGRIADTLSRLTEAGVIDGWVKDSDPQNPTKINWVVQISKYQTRRWETSATEAFLEGVLLTAGGE